MKSLLLAVALCLSFSPAMAQQPPPNPTNQPPAPFSSVWWCDVFNGAESKVLSSKTRTQVAVGVGGWPDIFQLGYPISGSLHIGYKALNQIQQTGRCSGYGAPPTIEGWGIEAGLSSNLDWYVGARRIMNIIEANPWYIDFKLGWGLSRFSLGAITDAPGLLIFAPLILAQVGLALGYEQLISEAQNLFVELDFGTSLLTSTLTAKLGLRF